MRTKAVILRHICLVRNASVPVLIDLNRPVHLKGQREDGKRQEFIVGHCFDQGGVVAFFHVPLLKLQMYGKPLMPELSVHHIQDEIQGQYTDRNPDQ